MYRRVSSACVTEEKAKELAVCKVMPGDVLVAKVGDPPGTAAIYPKSQPTGIVTQDVIRIRVKRTLVNPEYLATFLNSDRGHLTLKPIIVEGTRTRFGLTPYKELPIPVPPLKVQNQFERVAHSYDRLRAQQREAYRQAEHLFRTLMHRAFAENA
jgi:type I restriction enzyme, S subunit